MPGKCFVVMGFGEKPDAATGRTLDLDKTYRLIIKRAVEDVGLECIRADEVIHSGVIDKPMYELLLDADVVVADLSTSNANAIYELGVRHALRPNTTVVIAEKQFKFPFDIGHLVVRSYEHLGKGIDGEEAERMRGELSRAIRTLVDKRDVDSPVYTFLHELKQPMRRVSSSSSTPEATAVQSTPTYSDPRSVEELRELFRMARSEDNWTAAARYLTLLLERMPKDPFLVQQLALATYKGKRPDPERALIDARNMLESLSPATTTDSETLGLWGAVHKRLYDLRKDPEALDVGIRAYTKGFLLNDDYYTGINFAFMLNMRAAISQPREALADIVVAERVRRRIIPQCRALLEDGGVKDDKGKPDPHGTFWVQATLLEALIGIGDYEAARALDEVIRKAPPEPWMLSTMDGQLTSLRELIVKTATVTVSS